MIGLGKLLNGLYYLEGTPKSSCSYNKSCSGTICSNSSSGTACTIFSIPQTALWHFRLGHASHARLEIMHKLYPSISVNKDCICDVCHLAK
jgi:hypothetical protein